MRACALPIAAVLIAILQGSASTVAAQSKTTRVACDQVHDADLRAASAKLLADFETRVLSLGTERFVAYATVAVKASPFALPQDPNTAAAAAITGMAWFRRPHCTIDTRAAVAIIRLTAGAIRFHEPASGWSAPQIGGTLAGLVARREAGPWTIAPPDEELSIFLPGARLTRPEQPALPALDEWPQRGCDTPKAWDSDRCVAHRAKLIR